MNKNKQAFETVKNHLLTQNEKATTHNGLSCRYRGDDGLKCAIGCLIPDDQYDPTLEGNALIYNEGLRALPCMGGLDINLMDALQTVHDCFAPHSWATDLDKVENKFAELLAA